MERSGSNDRRFYVRIFGLFIIFYAVFFHRVIFSGYTFAKPDIYTFYYPVWQTMTARMRSGGVPLWNPLSAFGTPFFANGQTCVFYPLSILLYLGEFGRLFNIFIVFHLVLASSFTALWIKKLGASSYAAVLSAISFGLSGYMLAVINLTVPLASVSYFPAALYFFCCALDRPDVRSISAAGFILLIQYLAGDVAVTYATLMVLSSITLYKSISLAAPGVRGGWRPIRTSALIGLLFIGSGAVVTLPYLEFLNHSQRWTLGAHEAMQCSMPFRDILECFIPTVSTIDACFYGQAHRQVWLNNYYCGVAVCFLAVAAVCIRPSRIRRPVVGSLCLGAFGLLLATGEHMPAYSLFSEYIPLFHMIRSPVRFFFMTAFAVSCLAGMGLDALVKSTESDLSLSASRKGHEWLPVFFLLSVALVIVAWNTKALLAPATRIAWGFYGHLRSIDHFSPGCFAESIARALDYLKRSLALAALAGTIVFALRLKLLRKPWVAGLFIMLVITDLGLVNDAQPLVKREIFRAPSAHLRKVLSDRSSFRVMSSPKMMGAMMILRSSSMADELEQMKDSLASNFPMMYGLYDARDYGPVYLSDTGTVSFLLDHMKLPDNRRLLDSLNIKYLASPSETIPGLELVQRTSYANLFSNQTVMARAYFTASAVPEPDRSAILQHMLDPGYDPEKTVYVEAAGLPAESEKDTAFVPGKKEVRIVSDEGDRLKIWADARGGSWLFLSDTFYPGWKCEVDGVRATIYRANFAFRAVHISAGRHRVEFSFEPVLFKLGGIVSLLTLSITLYLLIRQRRMEARRSL